MKQSRSLPAADASVSRRRLLGVCGATVATGLAGCLVAGPTDDCGEHESPPNGFDLRTTDDATYSVTVEVISDWLVASSTVFEETYEISSICHDEAVRVADVVRYAGRYVIRVRLESDPDAVAEHLWKVTSGECDTVSIRIENGRIQIDQRGPVDTV